MGRIQDFLKRYKTTVDRQVDITSLDLMTRDPWLNPYMPLQTYVDYDLMVLQAKKNKSMAHVVGFTGEIPASKAGNIGLLEYGLIKLAKSYIYDEEDMKLLRKWQSNVSGVPDQVRDYFFGTVSDLPMALGDLHLRLTCEALYSGAIAFQDNITSQNVALTYTTDSNQYPSALTTTSRWNQAATATPIKNLRDHAETFRRTVKVGNPAATVMNSNTLRQVFDTYEVRDSVSSDLGQLVATGADNNRVPTLEEFNQALQRRLAPPVLVVDETYEEENADGTTTESFFVPDGYYFLLWNAMGERALGPVESNDGQAGIYAFTEEVSKEPPVDRSVGVGTGIPLVFDTRKMGGRKVY
ncbi:MAG: hypothetical protein AAF215_27165 [Cyanobacteria bacterium P01_A01_bin.123]